MKRLLLIIAVLVNGELYSQPTWVYSGAPIGDASIQSYPIGGWTSSMDMNLQYPGNQDKMRFYSATGTPDGVHIYRVDASPNETCGISNVSGNNRYFGVFVVNGTSPTYSLDYNYAGNSFVTPTDEPNLDLAERPTNADVACPAWTGMSAILDMVGDKLSVSGVSGRKELMLTAPVPLPVTLMSFTANCAEHGVKVEWITAMEVNNAYFTIERSLDGVYFDEIATIDGAGNSSTFNDYYYTDIVPSYEKTYYRLKQTDFNGDETVFDWKVVDCMANHDVSIYPNPATNEFTIHLEGIGGDVFMEVYDAIGNRLIQKGLETNSQLIQEDIDVSQLSDGVYFVHIKTNGTATVEVKKLLIHK